MGGEIGLDSEPGAGSTFHWPDAERYAHTLKGVAGSLGAHQLEREAADVEAALRRRVVFPDLGAVLGPDGLVAQREQVLPEAILVSEELPQLRKPSPRSGQTTKGSHVQPSSV